MLKRSVRPKQTIGRKLMIKYSLHAYKPVFLVYAMLSKHGLKAGKEILSYYANINAREFKRGLQMYEGDLRILKG